MDDHEGERVREKKRVEIIYALPTKNKKVNKIRMSENVILSSRSA